MNDPLEITPLPEDMEAQLWAEVQLAREELRELRSRLCRTADERFDRDHDQQQAFGRLHEAEDAWSRFINATREETQ